MWLRLYFRTTFTIKHTRHLVTIASPIRNRYHMYVNCSHFVCFFFVYFLFTVVLFTWTVFLLFVLPFLVSITLVCATLLCVAISYLIINMLLSLKVIQRYYIYFDLSSFFLIIFKIFSNYLIISYLQFTPLRPNWVLPNGEYVFSWIGFLTSASTVAIDGGLIV